MKMFKNGSLLSAVIMVVAGLILLIHPGDSLITAARLIGWALVLIGAVTVAWQLLQKNGRNAGAIIAGAVEIVVGIIVLSAPAFVISLFPVIVGIGIVLYGASDLLAALRLRKLVPGRWKGALIMSVITILLGILILANPFSTLAQLVRIIGIVLIYKGITGLFIRRA